MNAQDYDPVWSGNTWRSYPQPEIAQPPVKMEYNESTAYTRVSAALAEDWMSRSALRERAGIDGRVVRAALDRLVADGTAESQIVGGKQSGRRGRLQTYYRRRQTQEAA